MLNPLNNANSVRLISSLMNRRGWLMPLLLALVPAFLQAQESLPALEWVRTFSAGLSDQAYDVAADTGGNIIIAGNTYNSSGLPDARVIKFSAAGDTIWNRQLDTALYESVMSVDTDHAGNIYMIGMAAEADTPSIDIPCRVWKLDPDGNEQWHKDFLLGPYNACYAVAVDTGTNIYGAGKIGIYMTGGPHALLFKLNSDGQLQWNRTVNAAGYSDHALGAAVDFHGDVVIGGTSQTPDELHHFMVTKFDSHGLLKFTRLYRPGTGSNDSGQMFGLAIDPQDNLLMGGGGFLAPLSGDLYIKATSSGTEISNRFFPAFQPVFQCFGDASSDDQGNFYCAGRDQGDLTTSKLDASGQPQWLVRLSTAGQTGATAGGVDLDGDKNVYVAWTMRRGFMPYSIMAVAKYRQGAQAGQYGITRIPGDVQIVTVNSYTAPLISLVNVFGTTNPASGIGVDFTISTFPVGAAGYELTKASEATNAQGLADVLLKLGNIPAEYGVTATCASCETSASSVTFTCCGKLTGTDFKQYDVAWSTHSYDDRCHLIGSTVPFNCNPQSPPPNSVPFTIRQRGCAMTAMADVLNYYHDRYALTYATTTPSALNQYLRNSNGFDNGDVNFYRVAAYTSSIRTVCYSGKTDFPRTTLAALHNRIDANLAQGNPVILRVPSPTNPSHFVVATGKCAGNYLIADPGQDRATINPSQIRGIREFSLVTGSICPTP